MSKYYEVSSPRLGKDGKTYWRRIGAAFPAKDGKEGMNVELELMPLPDKEGRVSFIIRPPNPKDTDSNLNDNPGF